MGAVSVFARLLATAVGLSAAGSDANRTAFHKAFMQQEPALEAQSFVGQIPYLEA